MDDPGPRPLTRLAHSYKARAIDLGWIRGGNYFWLLIAIAGGFALRVNRLAAQSLWNDEGTSIALARLSSNAIAEGAARDIHPPLYYLLLHFWMDLGGDSEFVVRFLSVLAGVLLVGVTFRIAREFFDQEVAVIAAFLSALSAFQLYYSQETRMYILVALWSALSVWAMVRMLLPLRTGRATILEGGQKFPSDPQGPGGVRSHALKVRPRAGGAGNEGKAHGEGARGITVAWLAYVLTTSAALYTHYFAFTLVLFENLAFVAWLGLIYRARQDVGQVANSPRASLQDAGQVSLLPCAPPCWRGRVGLLSSRIGLWIAAQVVVALAFLPWLAFAGRQLTIWPAISEPLGPLDLVSRVLTAFVFKSDSALGAQAWIVAAYLVFFLAGLLPSLDLFKSSAWGILVAALWAVVPFAAMYAVSLRRPAYDPKFLLLATPGFFILVARGLSILYPGLFLHERRRSYGQERNGLVRSLMAWQFLLTIGIVASGALVAVQRLYYDPRLQRDDYRGIARYIEAMASADDAVLIDAPGQMDVFRYYYRGAAEVQALPIGRPLQLEATRAALDDLITGHRNLFAVFWAAQQADPDNVVERYLSTRSFKASDEWHGDVRLAQFALPRAFESAGAESSGERFGGEIELVQFNIGARLKPPVGPNHMRSVQPGSILPIDLVWQATEPPTANYKVFIHLLDAEGKIVSQRDTEPVSGFRPTGTWKAGETIEDPLALLIPFGTSAGKYSIELGVYRAEDGTRLRLASGDDHLRLDDVRVE